MVAPAGEAPPPVPPSQPGYRTVVRHRADGDPLEDAARLDAAAPGFAAALDVERATRTRPADAWIDALARLPGVHVRSFGGLGRFSSISIRGASAQQVQVVLDGVPAEDGMAGLSDLSTLSADALGRAEVHRGYVPVRYGGAAMGGLLRLSTAAAPPGITHVEWGLGSYGAHQLRAGTAARVAPAATFALGAGLAGARGDFPYLDPGTPHDPFDDRTRRRSDNDYQRLSAHGKLTVRRGAARYFATAVVLVRDRGIPGPVGARFSGARESEGSGWLILGLDAPLPAPAVSAGLRASIRGIGRRFEDPMGTVGLGRNDQVQSTADAYTRAAIKVAPWKGAVLELVGDGRVEHVRTDERAALPPSGDGVRTRGRAGLGLELLQGLWDRRILIAAGTRIDAIASRFAVAPGAGAPQDPGRDDTVFGHAPRLSLRVRPTRALRLRVTGGRYYRPPTLVELFGDRGYAVGNPGLRPEYGYNADAGLTYDRPLGAGNRIQLLAAGFYTRSYDLIQWVQAGFVARPENFPGAHLAGAEAGAAAHLAGGIVQVRANYTYLFTYNLDPRPERHGAPLPGRPGHDVAAGLALQQAVVRHGIRLTPQIAYEVEAVAATYLDPSARYRLPPRVYHGVSAGLDVDGFLRIALAVRNLADRRVGYVRLPARNLDGPIRVPIADILGYPLPGRSLWVTVALRLPPRWRTT